MNERTLHRRVHLLVVIAAGLAWAGKAGAQESSKDAATGDAQTTAIRATSDAFVKAFNAGDADAVAATFTEDGRITDESGETIQGRDEIAKRFTQTFQQVPGATIEVRPGEIKFISPDVAIEDGEAVIKLQDEAEGAVTRYTAIYAAKDGQWLQALVRDHPDPPAATDTPHDQVSQLAWMLGEWVEEGEGAVSESTCAWDDSQNFLVWKYTIRDQNANAPGGTTWIGWDPLTKQIKSWVFDAAGGHGEATWTLVGPDEWMVKASGVLADGRTASATQYVKRVGEDRASWTSFDRVAGGEPSPDVSEYVLARKPPKAGSTAAPKAAPTKSAEKSAKAKKKKQSN